MFASDQPSFRVSLARSATAVSMDPDMSSQPAYTPREQVTTRTVLRRASSDLDEAVRMFSSTQRGTTAQLVGSPLQSRPGWYSDLVGDSQHDSDSLMFDTQVPCSPTLTPCDDDEVNRTCNWVSPECAKVSPRSLTSADIAFEILEHFPGSDIAVTQWQVRLASKPFEPLLVASLCSGSDAPIRGMQDVIAALEARVVQRGMALNKNYSFRAITRSNKIFQVLACDKAAYAQRFLKSNPPHVPGPLIFREIAEVAKMEYAFDMHGQLALVPCNAGVLWSSFSCKAMSMENLQRKGSQGIFSAGAMDGAGELSSSALETVVTFDGTVDFFAHPKNVNLKLGCSENVTALMKAITPTPGDEEECLFGAVSDSDPEPEVDICQVDAAGSEAIILTENGKDIYERFSQENCAVVHFNLQSSIFIHKALRHRVFLLYGKMDRLNLPKPEIVRRSRAVKYDVLAASEALAQSGVHLNIDDVLLPDGHELIISEEQKLAQRFEAAIDKQHQQIHADDSQSIAASSAKRMQFEKLKWVAEAKAEFEKSNIEWYEPSSVAARTRGHVGASQLDVGSDGQRRTIWFLSLPTAQKYNLVLNESRYRESMCLPAGQYSFVISRSPGRCASSRPKHGVLDCILPRSKIWLDWKQRYAMPQEKMACLGFAIGSYNDNQSCGISPSYLSHLAGNAISIHCAQAITLGMIKHFGDVL